MIMTSLADNPMTKKRRQAKLKPRKREKKKQADVAFSFNFEILTPRRRRLQGYVLLLVANRVSIFGAYLTLSVP
jgi:hypothetical protein